MKNVAYLCMDATEMKTKIIFSEKCLNYGGWHIEGPQRLKMAHEIHPSAVMNSHTESS